jgi:hypothetical protein
MDILYFIYSGPDGPSQFPSDDYALIKTISDAIQSRPASKSHGTTSGRPFIETSESDLRIDHHDLLKGV